MQIEEKYICFLIKDYELLEKYNEIWEQRLKIVSKKDLIVNTNFHNNKIPKEGSIFICWSVILIVSVFTTEKNNYLLEFLEECTYIIEKIVMKKISMKKNKYRMCLAFRFKTFQVIVSDSWNSHIIF